MQKTLPNINMADKEKLSSRNVLANYYKKNTSLAKMIMSQNKDPQYNLQSNNILNSQQQNITAMQFAHLKPRYVHGGNSSDKKNNNGQSLNDKLSALF